MNQYKIYRAENYIVVSNNSTGESFYGHVKNVLIDKSNTNSANYRVFEVKGFNDKTSLSIDQILQSDGSPYTTIDFETFYTENTGNFNSGGISQGVQSVTGAGVDNTDPQNPIITGGGGSQDLQSVLDEGNVSEDSEILMNGSTGNNAVFSNGVISFEESTQGKTTFYNQQGISSESIVFGGTNFIVLNNREDAGTATYVFYGYDTAGQHEIALKEHALQVFTNTTTVVLSSATLSSTYPTAKVGDRVQALSIIAGALIYEKTATGWCQFPVTAVL